MSATETIVGQFLDYGGAGINSMHPSGAASGDGATDDRAALATLDAAAVAAGVPLVLTARHRVATDITIASEVIRAGGALIVDAAATVTFSRMPDLTHELFGAVGNDVADDTDALMALNRTARAAGARLVTVRGRPEAVYRYDNNLWMRGIRQLRLVGGRYRCVKSSATDFDEYAITTNPDMFINLTEQLEAGTHTFTFGYLIEGTAGGGAHVAAGSASIKCITAAEAANLVEGEWALVYGQPQQENSFPPNCRYFDFVKVVDADAVTGIVTLDRALRHKYRTDWYDEPSSKGKARILPLSRATYQFGEKLVIEDVEWLLNPNNALSQVLVQGYSQIEVVRCRVPAQMYIGSCERAVVRDTYVEDEIEWDKFIDFGEAVNCDVGDHTQAAGVNHLRIVGGSARAWAGDLRARIVEIDGLDMTRADAADTGTFRGSIGEPMLSYRAANCRAHLIGGPAVNAGVEFSLTVDALVDANTIRIANSSANFNDVYRGLHEGFIIRNEADGNRGVVRDVYADATYFYIDADFDFAPAAADVFKWPATRQMVVEPTNVLDGTFAMFDLTNAYDVGAANLYADPPALQSMKPVVVPFEAWDGLVMRRMVRGYIRRITVIVQRAYTGSTSPAEMRIESFDPSGTTFAIINLDEPGVREIHGAASAGAETGDTLTPTGWLLSRRIQIYAGAGSAGSLAGTAAELPKGYVVFEMLPQL